jgi:hypothetical protein
MVYTRSQKSASISAAAHALLALRGPLSFNRYTLAQPTTSVSSTKTQFWSSWTNWYHAFLSEITDEYPSLPIAERRAHATSRWVSYTAKQFRCPEPQVRAWLRTANQNDLVAAYA